MSRKHKKTESNADVSRAARPITQPLIAIAVVFALSRVVYYLLGVKFDSSPLDSFWQYIDPVLLKTDLFRSLYYLHSQPPLFNLYLGVMLKLFGSLAPLAFHLSFMIMGLVINAGMFFVLENAGVSRKISLTLVLIFLLSPASILYENFLFYTYPVATLLMLAALALQIYLKGRPIKWLVGFFIVLMFLVYTRSAFHLVWFAAVVGGLLLLQSKYRRQILVASAIPFLLCVMLYAKNAALFGNFGASSWFGMNLARLTTWQLPVDTRYDLIRQGKLSTLSLVKPFRPLDTYERHSQIPLAPATGIPVLDQTVKSTGAPNLNNETYLRISDIYGTDAKYVLTHYPGVYVMSVAEAAMIYCVPASSYSFLKENRSRISLIDHLYNLVLYGQFAYEEPITDTRTFFNTGLFTLFIYLAILSYGFILLSRRLSRRGLVADDLVLLGFIWFTALYISVVGNAVELGENNRFRFMIDPYFYLLAGLLLERMRNKHGNRPTGRN